MYVAALPDAGAPVLLPSISGKVGEEGASVVVGVELLTLPPGNIIGVENSCRRDNPAGKCILRAGEIWLGK